MKHNRFNRPHNPVKEFAKDAAMILGLGVGAATYCYYTHKETMDKAEAYFIERAKKFEECTKIQEEMRIDFEECLESFNN